VVKVAVIARGVVVDIMKSDSTVITLIVIVAALVLFNQYMVFSINNSVNGGSIVSGFFQFGSSDIANVDVTQSKSTAQSVALLFPIDKIKTVDDAIGVMISKGTPDYGPALGMSYDDPVGSLNILQNKVYPEMAKTLPSDSATWQRYLNLATKPVGISCEFCCGVGTVSITSKGQITCGCSHNLAVHGLTMWLMKNTDYTDAQILKEVLKWKTLWFPKNMVMVAYQDATQGVAAPAGSSSASSSGSSGSSSDLNQLSGMVGGC